MAGGFLPVVITNTAFGGAADLAGFGGLTGGLGPNVIAQSFCGLTGLACLGGLAVAFHPIVTVGFSFGSTAGSAGLCLVAGSIYPSMRLRSFILFCAAHFAVVVGCTAAVNPAMLSGLLNLEAGQAHSYSFAIIIFIVVRLRALAGFAAVYADFGNLTGCTFEFVLCFLTNRISAQLAGDGVITISICPFVLTAARGYEKHA